MIEFHQLRLIEGFREIAVLMGRTGDRLFRSYMAVAPGRSLVDFDADDSAQKQRRVHVKFISTSDCIELSASP